jgi:hypothetical protein
MGFDIRCNSVFLGTRRQQTSFALSSNYIGSGPEAGRYALTVRNELERVL